MSKGGHFLIILKGPFLVKKYIYKSDDRGHVADCGQQFFQQSSDHVDKAEALEISVIL